MNIIEILLPLALLLGFGFVGAFVYAVKTGQFDDCETPAVRMLYEDVETTRLDTAKVEIEKNDKL